LHLVRHNTPVQKVDETLLNPCQAEVEVAHLASPSWTSSLTIQLCLGLELEWKAVERIISANVHILALLALLTDYVGDNQDQTRILSFHDFRRELLLMDQSEQILLQPASVQFERGVKAEDMIVDHLGEL
jgi:hypothetical protein